jgi:hypothetical protein
MLAQREARIVRQRFRPSTPATFASQFVRVFGRG